MLTPARIGKERSVRMILGFLIGAVAFSWLTYKIADFMFRNDLISSSPPVGVGAAYTILFLFVPVAALVGGIVGAVIAFFLGR